MIGIMREESYWNNFLGVSENLWMNVPFLQAVSDSRKCTETGPCSTICSSWKFNYLANDSIDRKCCQIAVRERINPSPFACCPVIRAKKLI